MTVQEEKSAVLSTLKKQIIRDQKIVFLLKHIFDAQLSYQKGWLTREDYKSVIEEARS